MRAGKVKRERLGGAEIGKANLRGWTTDFTDNTDRKNEVRLRSQLRGDLRSAVVRGRETGAQRRGEPIRGLTQTARQKITPPDDVHVAQMWSLGPRRNMVLSVSSVKSVVKNSLQQE